MFELEQNKIENQLREIINDLKLPETPFEWRRIPFSGEWGLSTSFFAMAAQAARQGKKVNVPARAQEIAELLAERLGKSDDFSKVEAVRGYLNLYFSTPDFTQRVLDEVLDKGDDFGKASSKNEKVMVEYSQPNTHKAFHVGHLRNVILGTAVCNILDWAGYDVIRTNYIGDIGLHVIKWLWNYLKNHAGETPADEKIKWMGDIYAEAAKCFEEPEVEKEVRALFARWQNGDPEITQLWDQTRQWSMEAFDQVYDLLGVQFNKYYYESEVEQTGIALVNQLIADGIARDERPDDSVIIPLDELLGLENEYKVMVILRSDGTSLYATKDLPLAIKKFKDYDLTKSVYVIDVRQSFYLKQIFKTLEIIGYKEYADKCYHLAYEIVNLPGNVTMSSREGTVVLLEDLINEATERALEIVSAKNPELEDEQKGKIALAVALGAIKYSMLSKDNTKVVTFDWERAMDFNGQAAPYIQYAYVRAGSILKKAGGEIPGSLRPGGNLHSAEVQLIELMTRLPMTIQRAAEEYRPLLIASLAYGLSRAFNEFYNQCPVLKAEASVQELRLRLVAAARHAIANCLALLGIIAPDAM
ncbi:MAG: arginine--tRNA ligase [Anaerolineaceae bacterium]|nr:arginine--tRNA ligase [Anaerolineaceae bacterium]